MSDKFFPHKYQTKKSYEQARALKDVTVWDHIFDYVMETIVWITIGIYLLLAANEIFSFFGQIKPLSYLFEGTIWVVHLIFLTIIGFKAKGLYNRYILKTL